MSHRVTISMDAAIKSEVLAKRALDIMGVNYSGKGTTTAVYIEDIAVDILLEGWKGQPNSNLQALGLRKDSSGEFVIDGDFYGLLDKNEERIDQEAFTDRLIQAHRAAEIEQQVLLSDNLNVDNIVFAGEELQVLCSAQ